MKLIANLIYALGSLCLMATDDSHARAQNAAASAGIECRKSDSPTTPTIRCGPVLPSFIPCAETGSCWSQWEQDVFGNNHVFYYCTGGSTTTFDPLFTLFEKLPAEENEQGSNSLWLKQKRWCSARFACQRECQEMLGLGVKCVADENQFIDGTTIDYWVPVLASDTPIECSSVLK